MEELLLLVFLVPKKGSSFSPEKSNAAPSPDRGALISGRKREGERCFVRPFGCGMSKYD